METTAGGGGSQVLLYSSRQFSAQKGVGKQRVGKQTSGQNIKGEIRSETGAHRRLSPRFKTKASSDPVPGLLTV